jgi:hypothetical protein
MNLPWFRQSGILFIPVSFIGWLAFSAALAYSVYVYIDIDSRSHSVSDTLTTFAFNFLIIGTCYSLLAYFTSGTPKQRTHRKSRI